MSKISVVYDDIKAAKDIAVDLFDTVAWEAEGDLLEAADKAARASELFGQVADDLDALGNALLATRGE